MIKKKFGWSIYYSPIAPIPPKKPKKELIVNTRSTVKNFGLVYEEIDFSKADLPDHGRLILVIERDYDSEGQYETLVRIDHVCSSQIVSNTKYEEELKIYRQKMKEHKKKLNEWRKEKKEWEAWAEQEKQKILSRQLEQAKDLLKKHGQL